MQSYIGCKIIKAEAMSQNVFLKQMKREKVKNPQDGYRVEYPDGYISWSPTAAFEEAYRLIGAKEKELMKEDL